MDKFVNTGGAHGINISEFVVIEFSIPRRLALSDIFKPGFKEALDKILDRKLRNTNGIGANENLRDHGFFVEQVECVENFYINNSGIGFYYNVYHLAPYISGGTEIFIRFNEILDLLAPEHPFIWMKE
jgi:hypothetical protein